jgi:nitric oxide reductase NorQ protein
MTVLKTRLADIIRDYLYDETGRPGGKALTLPEIAVAITRIQNGRGRSNGAIRKILSQLANDGHITRTSSRIDLYRWNPAQPKPQNYVHRAIPKTSGGTMPPASVMTEAEKRADLHRRCQARMNEILNKPAPQPEPVPAKKTGKGVKRVNGQVYQPRELAGTSDIEAIRRLRDKGIYTLLEGPPGTGKTALVDAALGEGEGGLHVVTANENTGVEAFMGQFSPTGNPASPYFWVDGPLVNAMRSGGALFIDDVTLANPRVLAVIYPAMDGRGEVIVADHIVRRPDGTMGPDIVQAKEGFYVIAAHNPGVDGAHLSDALASRFVTRIWVETDLALAGSLGVTDKFIKLVKMLRADQQKEQPNIWVPQLRELLAARDVSGIFGEQVAAANLLRHCPEEDQDWVQSRMRVIFNGEIRPFELGEQL